MERPNPFLFFDRRIPSAAIFAPLFSSFSGSIVSASPLLDLSLSGSALDPVIGPRVVADLDVCSFSLVSVGRIAP